MTKRLLIVLCALAIAFPALAQIPTATIAGSVDDGELSLPGVTVTVTSPSLQGVRTAVTGVNGDYVFRFMPPGDYLVKFDLSGFQTIETTVKLSGSQTSTVNATMPQTTVAEEVTVTGSYETLATASTAASTATKQLVDQLPIGRTITAAIAVAAGTSFSGPGGNVTISGAQSYENLWLVNGVVVNENVRQQALPLFIEDAIQETTTQTSGVSAEFGRFAGGVVSTLTKSGGNEFSGSIRDTLTNADWNSQRPMEAALIDKTNQTWEATLGGFIVKDHLWFFAAARDIGDTVTRASTSITNIPYSSVTTEKRYEGKLTFSLTPEHRLIGSYTKIDSTGTNTRFGTVMDLRSLTDREDPQEILAVNYTGVITDAFFVEGQYSKRDYTIGIGGGSPYTDRIRGTLLLDRSRSNRRFWSPTFCGAGDPDCPDKERNNSNYLVKGSYFLTTPSLGSMDFTFGYDHFEEFYKEENHQSGSDYRIYATKSYITSDPIVPAFSSTGRYTYFYYQPALTANKGAKTRTDSFYINDRWRLTSNLSFNLGLRYDMNNADDSGGNRVSDDSRLSPRLGGSWDIKGDGDIVVNATASRYVTAIAGSGNVGDAASTAGLTGVYLWYGGPDINMDPNALVSTEAALQQFFAWLDSVGGAFQWANNSDNWIFRPDYPGITPVLLKSLQSPYVDEYTVGASKRIGNRGLVRFDYVYRKYSSFYITQTDMTTGVATNPAGIEMDRAVVTNDTSGKLYRKYDGFNLAASYRLGDRITLSGNYTLSFSKGNFIGETDANGPITTSALSYPEYNQARWSRPGGYLDIDERHKLRIFGTWDAISTKHHRVNLGFAHYVTTGAPYDAQGTINVEEYVENPGYVTPDGAFEQTYYFSSPAHYRLPTVQSTDLSITYSFVPTLFGQNIEIYIKPEVRNIFNNDTVINVNTQVDTANDVSTLQAFNPFTTTKPQEGVHWQKGASFGKPQAYTDYQLARRYFLAVGIRF